MTPQSPPGAGPEPESTSGTRGPYRKGKRRRALIIEAATEAFALSGYHATSMGVVAERAGLTVPGLLHYFPSKTHLLMAVLEQRDSSALARLPAEASEWRARLRGTVEIVRHNETMPRVIAAFSILESESLQEGHPASAWSARRLAEMQDRLTLVFDNGIVTGTMRPEARPRALAAEIIAVLDGLQLQWLRQEQSFSMADVFSDYVERLIAIYET